MEFEANVTDKDHAQNDGEDDQDPVRRRHVSKNYCRWQSIADRIIENRIDPLINCMVQYSLDYRTRYEIVAMQGYERNTCVATLIPHTIAQKNRGTCSTAPTGMSSVHVPLSEVHRSVWVGFFFVLKGIRD